MNNQKISTEELIYKAAEEEFIERGYDGAKMMSIAKRAGVSHSMLHYYYKSKECLFQEVIQRCSLHALPEISSIIEPKGLSFLERTRLFVELHFNSLRRNPRLLYFLIETVSLREKNKEQFWEIVSKEIPIFKHLEALIDEAVKAQEIRPVKAIDYIINLVSINSSSFIWLPLIKEGLGLNSEELVEAYLKERCEQNVLFIQNALRLK